MSSNIIQMSAYRTPPAAPSPVAPDEYFITQYEGREGCSFGTIDGSGTRTIVMDDLSMSEAAALLIEAAALRA